ncbi:hypothetical protein RB597_002272 [Gaeumannomyces tritici]
MSGVWGWFGGGAAQKRKETPKNAILGLRSQLDMLQKRQKHLETQIAEQDGIARKNVSTNKNAAKAALKRKKTHEHSLDQTVSQIGTLEQQINAIESANINMETLEAMKKAGKAMEDIHGKLTVDKVDETMCVAPIPCRRIILFSAYTIDPTNTQTHLFRDKLREQNALSEEIVNAITNNSLGDPIDEDELEEELEALEQEKLDEQMLNTGTVRASEPIHRLPQAVNGERKFLIQAALGRVLKRLLTRYDSQGQGQGYRGGRRGSRAQEVASRDGHVGPRRYGLANGALGQPHACGVDGAGDALMHALWTAYGFIYPSCPSPLLGTFKTVPYNRPPVLVLSSRDFFLLLCLAFLLAFLIFVTDARRTELAFYLFNLLTLVYAQPSAG